MTTKLARLSIQVALAAVLCGFGKTADASPAVLPRSDPYIQALYATMNYTACKFFRRPHSASAQLARLNAAISEFELEVARAEAKATSAGHGGYLELGRLSFRRRVARESHVGCHPNEAEAAANARSALDQFRLHIDELTRRR